MFELARSARGADTQKLEAAARPSAVRPAEVASSVRIDMRALIREAIERANVRSAAELDPFLAELEARARRQGKVTALEIEPGIEKCHEFGAPEKAARFAERMLALQRELDEAQPKPALSSQLAVARTRVADLFYRIQKTGGEEREKLIRDYLRAVDDLPAEEQPERHSELNRVAGRIEQPTDPATLDALLQGIERAGDEEERQDLIREYLTLVDTLPAEQSQARMEEINRRYGKHSPAGRGEPGLPAP